MINKKDKLIISTIVIIIIFFILYFGMIKDDSNTKDIIIPNGFKIIEKDISKGLVIEDNTGNQFVWIPVNNKEITLSRKTFVDNITNVKNKEAIERIYYGEEVLNSVTRSYKDDKKNYVYDIDYFKESVKKYGGFYISRYEIGDKNSKDFRNEPTKGKIASKKGLIPYNFISRDEALSLSQNIYYGIKSTLINSYAWDTTLEYISQYNKDYVLNKKNNINKKIMKTGESNDVVNNIYDLSGNVAEWTTEYSSNASYEYQAHCVYRGEAFNSDDLNPSVRNYNDNIKNEFIGFRIILYF